MSAGRIWAFRSALPTSPSPPTHLHCFTLPVSVCSSLRGLFSHQESKEVPKCQDSRCQKKSMPFLKRSAVAWGYLPPIFLEDVTQANLSERPPNCSVWVPSKGPGLLGAGAWGPARQNTSASPVLSRVLRKGSPSPWSIPSLSQAQRGPKPIWGTPK